MVEAAVPAVVVEAVFTAEVAEVSAAEVFQEAVRFAAALREDLAAAALAAVHAGLTAARIEADLSVAAGLMADRPIVAALAVMQEAAVSPG